MKLIIDINEETYKKCKWKNNGVVGLEWWERAIVNGTPIPDNATNGDVIKTIFTNTLDNFCERTTWAWNSWWISPYQKGGKGCHIV